MKSNKYLLQQSGQNYLIRDAKGVTTKIGDLATNGQDGADGLSVLTGSGDPSAGLGRDGEIYIDIDNFKLFNKSAGSWSAGTNFNGRSVLFGNGAPLDADGRNLESYIDLDNFKIHTKSAGGSWNSGSLFKGTDGSRGKTILEGDGPPGTSAGNNYATATAALTSALSDAGLSAGDLTAGDLYMDTTNHFVYKKTASGWAKRATTLRGGDGSIGPAGLNAIHAHLTQDSYTLLANPYGLSYSLTKASGSFRLRTGFEFISSSDITFYAGESGFSTSQTSNGLTLSINSAGKYTLSGDSWSDDSETFTMRAIYSGSTYTKDYSISKAKAGFAGENGLSVRFGSGSPLVSLGSNNEVYIDTTNFKLHTKSGGSWSAGTAFRGSDGTNGTKFKGILPSLNDSGDENDTGIFNNKIYKRVGSSWVDQSVSVKGDKGDTGDTGATGPGVKVYSVALGSDSSTADTALTTSFADMYLADVMTNEGSILTATSSKGSTTSFTMSSTGRYKIEIQAAVRAVNYSTSATYNPTVTIRILNSSTSTALLDSTVTLLTGTATQAPLGTVFASTDSDTLSISRIFRFTSGTVIKIQAKTSTLASSSPTKLTYLQLATDDEAVGSADTVVTFTKL